MGAWGAGSFENDGALDWLGDCADSDVGECVNAAFDTVLDSPGYLEEPDCTTAIAGAEVVAAALGKPCDRVPEEAVALAQRLSAPSAELVARAQAAIARVLQKSELRELWEESDSLAEWQANMQDLEARLSS